VPSFDSGDDFIGVLGPGKRHWVCIGVVEEGVDGIREFVQGSEHAALEALLGEFGKEPLDGIKPGGRCRSEVEDKPWMLLKPFHDVGMLVGGTVVDDDLDGLFLEHPGGRRGIDATPAAHVAIAARFSSAKLCL
jgi:hypothetical protein